MAIVTSPISLTSGELSINKNLSITGPGSNLLTVRRSSAGGTPDFRIINIASGTVSISGLTVTNGNTPNGAPGGAIGANGVNGGGINNAATLTMSDVSVVMNRAGNGGTATNLPGGGGRGGGIYDTGTLTMTNCTVNGNNAGLAALAGVGAVVGKVATQAVFMPPVAH